MKNKKIFVAFLISLLFGMATIVTATTVLPITQGGTGQQTANSAFNALAPNQTGHNLDFLMSNGTDSSWAHILSSPLAIGEGIGGSTPFDVLFVDAAKRLAEDANKFVYHPALGLLTSPLISVGSDITYNSGRPAEVFTQGDGAQVAPKNEGAIMYNDTKKVFQNSVSLGSYQSFLSDAGSSSQNVLFRGSGEGKAAGSNNFIWNGHGLQLTNSGGSGGIPTLGIKSSLAEDIFRVYDRGRATLDSYASGGQPALTITQNVGGQPALKIVDGTEGLGKVLTSDASGNASWQTGGGGGGIGGTIAVNQLAFGTGTNIIGGNADAIWNESTHQFTLNGNSLATQVDFDASGTGRWRVGDMTGGIGAGTFWDMQNLLGTFEVSSGSSVHFKSSGSFGTSFFGDNGVFGDNTHYLGEDSTRTISLNTNVPHTGPTIPVPTPVLDDVTISGTYTGQPTTPVTYTLTISATGTPDLVDFTDGTTTITAQPINSPLAINGITWSALASTGHGLGDSWTMTATNTATSMIATDGLANTVKVSTLVGSGNRVVQADSTGTVTATNGVCSEPVSPADFDAQTIGITATTIFTAPNDGIAHQYRIGGYLNINAVLTDAVEQRIAYTDKNGNSEGIKMTPIGTMTSVLSSPGDYSMQTTMFRAMPNTNIDFSVALTTGGGTINYDTGYTLEQCN